MERVKLAVFTSHPIQYQAPLFQKLAEEGNFDLMVFFFWDYGVKETYDENFRQKVKWDIPLLEGYRHEFLKNVALQPTSSHFWGEVNPSLVSRISRSSCDAALVLGWQTFSHWLAILTAWIRRVPVFVRGENPLNQELRKPAWKRAVKQTILRGLFRCVSGFLYIGEENREFYRYYGVPEKKLFFVPYAVDNEWFQSEAARWRKERARSRAKLGIKDKDCTFLFAGKLSRKKRPMDLLRAYELLITNYQLPTAPSLIFVGDGMLRPELERYAREHDMGNVHFVGFKNQTEMPEYYVLVDALVLPSGDGETWGLVVNEAMNFGLPVIVSDAVGCAPNLVRDGKNGFVVPVGDVEALAAALSTLAADGNVRRRFGEESLRTVARYGFEEDIRVLFRILNDKPRN